MRRVCVRAVTRSISQPVRAVPLTNDIATMSPEWLMLKSAWRSGKYGRPFSSRSMQAGVNALPSRRDRSRNPSALRIAGTERSLDRRANPMVHKPISLFWGVSVGSNRKRRRTNGSRICGPRCAFSLIFVVSLLALCACATNTAPKVPSVKKLYVYLTDSARYQLLPPQAIEQTLDMAQYITASFQNQEYYLNSYIRADETGMELSFFNELGASLGELSYRDGLARFSSSVFPQALKPEYIIADFQLCFYNPQLLHEELEHSGLTLVIDGTTRRILKGNNIIIEIEKNPGIVSFTNFLRKYRYTLEGDFP